VCVAASEKVRPDSTDVRFVNGALRFSADSGSVGRSVTTTCALKSGDLLLYEDACAAITRFHTDDSKTGQVVPMQGVESPHLIAPISNNMSVVEGILSNLTLTKWQMKSILDVTPGAVPDASNVRANARRITCFYGQTDIGVALYRLVPWFRHSCTPNAVFMTTNRHEAVVQLIRDVEKGDEIFVSRIDLPVAQHACSCIRSVELINAGQPACSCNACVREIEAGHVPCPAAKVIDVRKFYFECSISAVRRFSDPHADVFASEKRSASTASANDVLDAWCSDMDEHPDRILRGSHLTFFYFGKMVLMYAPMVTRQLRTEGTPEQKAKCDTFFTRMRRSAQRFEKEPGCLPALSFELARSNVVPGNNFNDVALSITRLMNAVDEGTFALHPDVSSTSVRLASGLGVRRRLGNCPRSLAPKGHRPSEGVLRRTDAHAFHRRAPHAHFPRDAPRAHTQTILGGSAIAYQKRGVDDRTQLTQESAKKRERVAHAVPKQQSQCDDSRGSDHSAFGWHSDRCQHHGCAPRQG